MVDMKKNDDQKQDGKIGIEVEMYASESPMMLLLQLLLLRRLRIKLGLRWLLTHGVEGQTIAKPKACSLQNKDVRGRVWL